MQRYVRIGGALYGVALLLTAACSGRSGGSSLGFPPVESAGAGSSLPAASATPPVTAPVTIPYPYTNTWVTKTWAGPTAKPVSTKGSDSGVTTVKFALDKKTGIYGVLERIKSKSGYVEDLHSAIAFAPYRGSSGIAQIILSDNYTFVEGPFSETGTDTYPDGQNSFDFPLTPGRRWSAAANHTSYVNEGLSGKGAFSENIAYTEAADGTYQNQTSFSSLGHFKNQDNYASTTNVVLGAPSTYTLSEPAAGYNKLTQVFDLPNGATIDVRNEGHKPLPLPPGTTKVPDWYPRDGALPKTLYSDRFEALGYNYAPPTCGSWSGQSANVVIEKFANLDPVQGFYNTYEAQYYLFEVASGQYWFACIIENYTNRTYANGWAMSAGAWGNLTSRQVGTEILIAGKVKSGAKKIARASATLPALTFPSLSFRTPLRR
jgi:hypothetical protein